MPAHPRRQDIQSLRGYAVLLVVLFHARLFSVPGGYFGVDVFFVISGFLMTAIIADDLDRGSFAFGTFYFRRAKRLLPALYVVLLAVALAAPLLLASRELRDLRPQLLGGLTFTANLALERQAGYFDGASELKPLLHLWSLSIEEQFYLLLPAVLWMIPAHRRFVALSLGVALSFGYSQFLAGTSGAFYGLASRAWELLLGAVGALWMAHRESVAGKTRSRLARWGVPLALAVLLLVPLRDLPFPHPGPQAALVAVATLGVLLGEAPALGRLAPLRWLGDRSYALYLVHWPLFALLHNAWMGPSWTREFAWARAGLVVVAVVLADLLYRAVERPIHRAPWRATRRRVLTGLGATAVVGAVAVATTRLPHEEDTFAFERRPNVGFAPVCEHAELFEPRAECRNAEAPVLMVWGDSFAMHLVPGLLATPGGAPALVQATKSQCAPLLDLAVLGRAAAPRKEALSCLASNDTVMAYLARTPSIRTVVLSSVLAPPVRTGVALLVRSQSGRVNEVPPSVAITLEHLERTAVAIRRLGRRVVLVGPTPSSGVDVARCAERRTIGLFTVGARPDCAIVNTGSFGLWPEVVQLLADAERRAVPVIRLSDGLCSASECRTMSGPWSLYRDEAHLSYRGSVEVATQLQLAERVRRDAR